MRKPIIGIPGNTREKFDNNDNLIFPITYTPHGFVQGINQAGAIPVVFPLSSIENAKDLVESVDAIVLAGGQDVSPSYYNEEPIDELGTVHPERDAFEIAIIKEVIKQNKPFLGICRGLQIYNIAQGGSLYQDLSQKDNVTVEHVQADAIASPAHSIDVAEDSWLSKTYGTKAKVNSFHHQALKDLGKDLTPIAWSDDGLIEGIQNNNCTVLHTAVQWHPEWMLDSEIQSQELFNNFVEYVKTLS